MGGEGGDRDARRRGADEFGERLCHLGFRRRAALAHGIGGIADQRQHALVAERGELRLIGRRPDQRRRIDFPVAGMHHRAERGADRERIRFRDRMRDIDEVDGERRKLDPPVQRRDIDRDLRRAGLRQPARFEQGGSERRGVKRHLELRPKIDQRAHMVFVRVGEHEADDVAALLDQEADVRQDEIDAGQVFFAAERDAAIDDQPFSPGTVAEAVDREIHPDLADAAERRENELRAGHQATPSWETRRPRRSPAASRPAAAATGGRAHRAPPRAR